MTDRETQRAWFAAKNERRRKARRKLEPRQHNAALEARRLRREDSGAFGHAPATDWNDRILGTTGGPR